MKTPQPHPDSVAEDRAALWAARLDGDTLDRAQRAELDAWLAENPAHRTLLSQYCQFSADLEEKVPALVEAGSVAMPNTVTRHTSGWRWPFPRLAVVSLATAAAAALVVMTVLRSAPPVQNIATSPAQRGSHTLADGTRVELNAQTSLRFENSKHERRARLASGEALFAVAEDPARPFIVETPTGSVRVTGTTFNVRTEPSATVFEVTVVEGSVQVRPNELGGARPSAPVALRERDQFFARDGAVSTQTLSESELDDALAWREGKVVFRNAALEDALGRYARHHGLSLTAAPAIAKEPVAGIYSIDDLNGFLDGLELVLQVKRQKDASGAVMIVPRSGR